MWSDCVSCRFKMIVCTWIYCPAQLEISMCVCKMCTWDPYTERRMLLRLKTRRRKRKCCISAFHGLLSSVTVGIKACWWSAPLGLISLTGVCILYRPRCFSCGIYIVFQPEPHLCFYLKDARHAHSDLQKCLLIETEGPLWRFLLKAVVSSPAYR